VEEAKMVKRTRTYHIATPRNGEKRARARQVKGFKFPKKQKQGHRNQIKPPEKETVNKQMEERNRVI
jgi:hypothetical protein